MKLQRLLPTALAAVILASCGAPADVKQKAADMEKNYSAAFEQKVSDGFGDEYKLRRISCDVIRHTNGISFETSYTCSDHLDGRLYNGVNSYTAEYYPQTGKLFSNVNTDSIAQELTGLLPIDSGHIMYTRFNNSVHHEPSFESSVKDLDTLAEYNDTPLWLYVITDKDIGGITEDTVKGIPYFDDNSKRSFLLTVVVVSVKDNAPHQSELRGKIDTLSFCYYDNHPEVYANGGNVDAFDYFGINRTVYISCADGSTETVIND